MTSFGYNITGFGAHTSASGDFTPTDISGLDGWWKFDEIEGLNDGDAIGQVDDDSGNSKHITQATAGYKPTFKTNIQNGLSVGRFSDDYLSNLTFPAGGAYGNNDWTLFWVGESDTTNAYREAVHLGSNVSGQCFFMGSSNTGKWRCGRYGGDYYTITSPTITANTWTIVCMSFDGTGDDTYGYINGAAATPTSGSYALNITSAYITLGRIYGYGQVWAGDMGEALIYDSVLSSDDRSSVTTYLGNKWDIAVS